MTRLLLVLARGPGKPDGDVEDRLVLGLDLTPGGQIDLEAFFGTTEPWLASREGQGGRTKSLEIIRIDESWALQSTASGDDPIWTFQGDVFRPGELVSLCRPDREGELFRIVAAEPV